MSDPQHNGGVALKWAHIAVVLLAQVAIMAAVWGSLKFQVESHERRLDTIEKKQEDNWIPRSEYDKRHQDMLDQLKELRQEIRDMQRKAR